MSIYSFIIEYNIILLNVFLNYFSGRRLGSKVYTFLTNLAMYSVCLPVLVPTSITISSLFSKDNRGIGKSGSGSLYTSFRVKYEI